MTPESSPPPPAAVAASAPSPAPRRGAQAWRAASELLSSMRFAIALLTLICIASVIGTVLKQHEPAANYVNQFGPFWAELFMALKLNAVYSAWWFLLILAFLVLSTSLCIARNTPKILNDLKTYKENIREQSLQAFHHKASATVADAPAAAAQRLGQTLAARGWKVRLQQRPAAPGQAPGEGWMVAAKAGAANKLGYLAAHSAIVLVCLGGLLDGDLIVRAQMLLGAKTPFKGGGSISAVPAEHRLSERNPTFRGNLMVAEGTQSSTAILSQSDGILIQELPFSVELKKFIVEYYPTGMPRLFASDIVIHDKATGHQQESRVEVNHPVSYKGIEIYQSGFEDGGSAVTLKAVPMQEGVKPFEVQGFIGGTSELLRGQGSDHSDRMTLEYTNLRLINVENFAPDSSGVDVRKVDLRQHLGAGNKTVTAKELRNVGPSITYKLRDAAGQAIEFNNYMLPVDMGDGLRAFLLGVRESQSAQMRYLRVPADENDTLEGFVRFKLALQNAALREQAVRRYAVSAAGPDQPQLVEPLTLSASRALGLFAGIEKPAGAAVGGLPALADFIEANVPAAERNRAGEMLIRILNGTLLELYQLSREKAGLAPADIQDDKTRNFMIQSILALADAQAYPVPMAFMLTKYDQVQASVFQVARAPGKTVVYLGCALLILGVFAMLYIRERRLWIWLAPSDSLQASRAMMALSSNRKTLDADREFEQLRHQLLGQPPAADGAAGTPATPVAPAASAPSGTTPP